MADVAVDTGDEASVVLSVCIPTYNFADYIGETLASIVAQLEPGIEICILDGGSTDDTEALVQDWQRRCPAIRYVRQPFRGGIDRDMARSVEIARGRYCWLFSADDIMAPGAMRRVVGAIASGNDIYLGTHSNCDAKMAVIDDAHPVVALADGETIDFAEHRARRRYFAAARSSEAFFSFIGSLIVRRDWWLSVALDENFVGSCWAHAARLLTLMKSGMKLQNLAAPLLARRGDNDSFALQGAVRRCALQIEGYHRLGETLFGRKSIEAFHIRRVVRSEFPIRYMLLLKYRCTKTPEAESAAILDSLVDKNFSDASLRNLLSKLAIRTLPGKFYPTYRKIYRFLGRRASATAARGN